MNANQLFNKVVNYKGNILGMVSKFAPNVNKGLVQNLINLAQKNDGEGLKVIARNIMRAKGRDFDKEFAEFMIKKDK